MKKRVTVKSALVLIALASVTGTPALASEILGSPVPNEPGYDLFETQPGTSVDLSGFGLGVVPLEGVPFGPGATDTIVKRKQGISPFEPPGGVGAVDIELVALHLKSIAPVDLTPLGGPFVGVFADLHTTINAGGIIAGLPQPDALAPSIGRMEIRHDTGPLPSDDIGGTWDSCFGDPTDPHPCDRPIDPDSALYPGEPLGVPGGGIFADAIFTLVGGDPGHPADILLSQPAARVRLSSTDCKWQHEQPPEDPRPAPGEDPPFPAGLFFPTDCVHDGPHSVRPPCVLPICVLTDYDPGPPKSIEVTTQDPQSGLASITVLRLVNALVMIPPFTSGTQAPVVVTATQIDSDKGARLELEVCDVAGCCTKCDPVMTEEVRANGKPVGGTYADIPWQEDVITIYNSDPGLKNLDVDVNGTSFRVAGLKDSDEVTLDVSAAVVQGQMTTVTLTAYGKPGGSAVVMIWEGNSIE